MLIGERCAEWGSSVAKRRIRKQVHVDELDGVSPKPGGTFDRSAFGHISDRLESLKTREFASGRRAAIEALDCLLGDHHNIQKLYGSLQDMFNEDPAEFMRNFVRLFVTPAMLESIAQHKVVDEAPAQAAVRTLLEAMSLAFQTRNPSAVVAARRELNLLQGLYQDTGETLTAETLRDEMLAMERTVAGDGVVAGGNGNGRRKRKAGRL